MKNVHTILVLGAILTLSFADNASAYLGPGTCSMLLQALLAAIAGALMMMHMYWGKLKSLFSSSHKTAQKSNTDLSGTENASR